MKDHLNLVKKRKLKGKYNRKISNQMRMRIYFMIVGDSQKDKMWALIEGFSKNLV